MKINFKISHRYAVSLLESMIEKKKTEKVFKDMQLFVTTLQSSNELQVALQSPVIKPEIKEKIIVDLFKNKILSRGNGCNKDNTNNYRYINRDLFRGCISVIYGHWL